MIKESTPVSIEELGKEQMPRKPKKQTQKYWEERLKRDGLSIEAGRNRKLVYAGDATNLEFIAGAEHSRKQGRTAKHEPS